MFNGLSETEMKYIKPIYEPYLVDKYFVDQYDKEIIYITKKNYKNDCPTLINHLSKFREIMEDRRENLQGKLSFYHLHWARDEHFFGIGEKILSIRKCPTPTFAYTENEAFVMMSFNVVKTNRINQKYLTAYLNSKVINFWLKNKGKMQGSNYQIDKEPLVNIPIVFSDYESEIIELFDSIKEVTKETNKMNDITDKIDLLFYKTFDFSDEEVSLIESHLLK